MKSGIVRLYSSAILAVGSWVLATLAFHEPVVAQEPWNEFGTTYHSEIHVLVKRYCVRCHSGKEPEGEIDFGRFDTFEDVRKSPRVWQKVMEMLESGQMPPKDAKQLPTEDRSRLQKWVRDYLKLEARVHAGDPGRVILRRLSNAEYTYTLRDLTGVESLQPAREFPIDGAAGEGFTNTGDALSMSPTLFRKYLDAAKGVAKHVVLLPDGLRFSADTTRQDWTNEVLAEIRTIYAAYSDSNASSKVKLQGLVWDAKQGGLLPIEKYLEATLSDREAIRQNRKSIEQLARERGLSAKYLAIVWENLNKSESNPLMDELRTRWRKASAADAGSLAVEVSRWQNALWKFNSVGHLGKVGGPKAWMDPVDPLVSKIEIARKLPPANSDVVTLSLTAAPAGDADLSPYVVWQQPRFVAPGRPQILLKDIRRTSEELLTLRQELFADTARYLQAVDEATNTKAQPSALAAKHVLDPSALAAWLDYLDVGSGPVKVEGHFKTKLPQNPAYKFIQGWGNEATPLVVANSSDQHVRIPGNVKPHSVVVHPSPTLSAVVGWRSPVAGKVQVKPQVAHAHPECGDGVSWSLELRRGATRTRLAGGTAQGSNIPKIEPVEISVKEGDLVSLVIGPRANHACDLTAVDLALTFGAKAWDLARDVSSDILAANPHPDRFGNSAVWHFYTEPANKRALKGNVIPADSVLDHWRKAATQKDRTRLAIETQKLLTGSTPVGKASPDALLLAQLSSLNGPILGRVRSVRPHKTDAKVVSETVWGLDASSFGRHPEGSGAVDPSSLCVKAPSVVEIRLPAELVEGYEFVTTGTLHPKSKEKGAIQLQVLMEKPAAPPVLQPGVPIVVDDKGPTGQRLAVWLDAFRNLFPPAVCYTKIVPVDEVVTLILFHREDQHLMRLMLDEKERQRLDRLWDELEYISQFPLTQVDAFAQLMEYASQDGDPRVFAPLRKPIQERANAFRNRLLLTEPKHLEAVLEFASRAYRRPLKADEKADLSTLYHKFRKEELAHADAIGLTLARVLVSPVFLYHVEVPGPGTSATPITNSELASRLSYFLWSSAPDAQLTEIAVAGKLREPDVLVAQARRLVQDKRVRRLATDFACQWLHIRGFDAMSEKSERHFPTFAKLRGPMYEESIAFFMDLFQTDRSLLEILDADYTFLNEDLARHYGIPGVKGTAWRRIEGVKKFGRGGILAQGTTLATQSGASRTSPILRGNWISEVLLGEKLPRPPKGVPQLPDDETKTDGLTVRELVEKHTSDPKCAVCHRRIDPYGFALEGFDAIGRLRVKDLANRPIDTRVKAKDGASFDGLAGLRNYLLTQRKDAFVRQFCRKLLGYALGRSIQLSDEPLLDEMDEQLKSHDYRVMVVVETIVRSRQFREIRGAQFARDE